MACARSVALWGLVVSSLVLADVARAQGHRPPAYPSRQIRCESESHRHSYCRTYAQGRVRLVKQLSKAPCRQYDTWGADPDGGGVWVREGCRAVFVVVPWGRGPIRRGPAARPVGVYRITCKSDRFRPKYCPMPQWGIVRLEKRLSDAPCRQYDTWGTDGGGIWVDRGCAAIFSVRY
jgi:hypothetical protein